MREVGFYWVKPKEDDIWQPAQFIEGVFWIDDIPYDERELYVINETRLIPPDEL